MAKQSAGTRKAKLSNQEINSGEIMAIKIAIGVILDRFLEVAENREALIDEMASGAMQLALELNYDSQGVRPHRMDEFRQFVMDRSGRVIRGVRVVDRNTQSAH